MISKSIFITGGAGYVGSCLVPELLKHGYKVTVYDIMYFGNNFLPKTNPNLKIINGDIRDTKKLENSCANHEFFLHLACISNDASFELDEKLSTSINLDAFEPSKCKIDIRWCKIACRHRCFLSNQNARSIFGGAKST